jgi:hypothetical protein
VSPPSEKPETVTFLLKPWYCDASFTACAISAACSQTLVPVLLLRIQTAYPLSCSR